MKPPSPPSGPPRAVMVPANSAPPSAQTIALPPSPASVASTVTTAPAATMAVLAGGTGFFAGRMPNPASCSGVARPPR